MKATLPLSLSLFSSLIVQEKNINGKRLGLLLFLLDAYLINMIGCINAPQKRDLKLANQNTSLEYNYPLPLRELICIRAKGYCIRANGYQKRKVSCVQC